MLNFSNLRREKCTFYIDGQFRELIMQTPPLEKNMFHKGIRSFGINISLLVVEMSSRVETDVCCVHH